MSPNEHLDWVDDNIAWFSSIDVVDYPTPVPACPGWDIAYVVGHLAIGVGWGYAQALDTPPNENDPYPTAPWPAPASGTAALSDQFEKLMSDCLRTFRRTDPTMPCWTYAGPGRAEFWFLRAAIETTLHRMDVADALGWTAALRADRAADAIRETVEFVLPFAAHLLEESPPAIELVTGSVSLQLGDGEISATVAGSEDEVVSALWGRGGSIEIDGDADAARAWLSLVEAAFGGR